MSLQPKPSIALVSYNSILGTPTGIWNFCNTVPVLIISEIFCPKSPISVSVDDPKWQFLVSHKNDLEKINIFIGKKTSGACQMIKIFCEEMAEKKSTFNFIVCPHQLKEKERLLAYYGISRDQYVVFHDGHMHTQCKETSSLLGELCMEVAKQHTLLMPVV